MAWRAHVWLGDVSLRGDDQVQGFYERIYYPTWTRLDGLVFGVLLAALKTWRPAAWAQLLARRGAVVLVGGACCVLAGWLFWDDPTTASTVFGYPLLSLGLACFVAACAHPSMRAVPGAGFLAATSYSLFLTHKQALHLVTQ